MITVDKTQFDQFFSQQLNANQQKAVAPKDGIFLVIAGAGSGKTRVITSRIINLLVNHMIPPSSIVALTFTNKAAAEMKERIFPFLNNHAQKPFIGTFHSYCLYLLRNNFHETGMNMFSILDADDQHQLLHGIIKKNGLEKRISAKNLSYQISQYKNNALLQNHTSHFGSDRLVQELALAYEKEKSLSKCLDFDDLLINVLTMFEQNKPFKEFFQQAVRHMLVDEYQDTNAVQHALLKHMTNDNATFAIDSLCVVGDEDQSIYSWRGATVTNILDFTKDFPQAHRITIDQNYRSVQPILDIANHVIQHNQQRNPKTLWSEKIGSDRVRILTCISGYQEGETISQLLKALIAKEIKLSSVGILYRAHYQSRVIEEALIRNAIPYRIIGGIQFYERKEIKDILAYLRLCINPFDRVSFFRIINCPQRGLGQKFEEIFRTTWEQQPFLHFIDIAHLMLKDGIVTGIKKDSLTSFLTLFTQISTTNKPSIIIQTIINEIGYYSYLKNSFDPEEALGKIENVKELLRAVQFFEEQGIPSIAEFLATVTLMQEQSHQAEHHDDRVQLMTLHAAKGLEFDTVTLSGLEEGLFPSTHSLYQPEQLEEERRLLYVGITRACERLLITHARYRYTFGTMTEQAPSRFLKEFPPSIQHHDGSTWNPSQSYSFFSQWIKHKESATHSVMTFGPATQPQKEISKNVVTTWKKNQAVTHQKFGTGIIKDIEHKGTATIITVQFRSGTKKVSADFLGII